MNTQTRSLYARTRNLLKADKRTLEAIARETGISVYWLQKFKTGPERNSSVTRIQKLYEFLTGKALC